MTLDLAYDVGAVGAKHRMRVQRAPHGTLTLGAISPRVGPHRGPTPSSGRGKEGDNA